MANRGILMTYLIGGLLMGAILISFALSYGDLASKYDLTTVGNDTIGGAALDVVGNLTTRYETDKSATQSSDPIFGSLGLLGMIFEQGWTIIKNSLTIIETYDIIINVIANTLEVPKWFIDITISILGISLLIAVIAMFLNRSQGDT